MGVINFKSLKIKGNVESDVTKVLFLMLKKKFGVLNYVDIFTTSRYDFLLYKYEVKDYVDFVDYIAVELEKLIYVNGDKDIKCMKTVFHNKENMTLMYEIDDDFYRFVSER